MAFRHIQFLVSSEPVIRHFNPDLPTLIYTDASKYAIGGYLAQIHPDGIEYVVR